MIQFPSSVLKVPILNFIELNYWIYMVSIPYDELLPEYNYGGMGFVHTICIHNYHTPSPEWYSVRHDISTYTTCQFYWLTPLVKLIITWLSISWRHSCLINFGSCRRHFASLQTRVSIHFTEQYHVSNFCLIIIWLSSWLLKQDTKIKLI